MGFSFRAHSPLKSLCDSHIPTQPGLRFCARAGRHAQSTTTITDPADLISDPMACVGCCREYPHGIECHCFAGGILACVAGSLNPQGMILGALSAAASTFGGTSGLLWMMNWLKGNRIPLGSEPEPLPIRGSWPWIVTAFVLALSFVVVLGPGVRFYGASGN